jgi:hypothetical protein
MQVSKGEWGITVQTVQPCLASLYQHLMRYKHNAILNAGKVRPAMGAFVLENFLNAPFSLYAL